MVASWPKFASKSGYFTTNSKIRAQACGTAMCAGLYGKAAR